MPNTPDNRDAQQPGSQEQRKRQQSNDKALQRQDNDLTDDDERIEAPGEDDDDATTLRTEQGGETGEDEDLPDGDTEVNRNPGNFANDREKASEAGRKGGQQ
jgi:general stress protein YciG